MSLDIPLLGSVYLPRESDSPTTELFSTTAHFIFGILTIIFFLIGVPGGILSLLYFLSKKQKTINTYIFIFINVTDVAICLLMVFVGISNFAQGEEMMFGDTFFCNLWAMLWQICIRLSTFLVGVLSITRVISILRPFKTIRTDVVLALIAVWCVLLGVQSTVPIWTGSHYEFYTDLSRCSWNSTHVLGCSAEDKVFSTLHLFVEWSLPVLPVLASCIILVYKLQCKQSRIIQNSVAKMRGESTKTVVILTIIFLLCSSTSAVFNFIYYIQYLRECGQAIRIDISALWMTLLMTYAIPLNSALNTVVYFCRIEDLRVFSVRTLRLERLVRKSEGGHQENKFEMQE